MDEFEKKALDDIKEHGCHILNILEEENYPGFSYSIGIQKMLGKPELIIIGLESKLSQSVINIYNERLKVGEIFLPNKFYSDFLDGFKVYFIEVSNKHYDEYFGWANWLYKGSNFKALQLIWPTTDNIWPWNNTNDHYYNWSQPILNDDGRIKEPQ